MSTQTASKSQAMRGSERWKSTPQAARCVVIGRIRLGGFGHMGTHRVHHVSPIRCSGGSSVESDFFKSSP